LQLFYGFEVAALIGILSVWLPDNILC
jgi:hypothetical protein